MKFQNPGDQVSLPPSDAHDHRFPTIPKPLFETQP